MRPLRSLLLLLIFLALFTGLHYIIPFSELFPPVSEFVPAIEDIMSDPSSENLPPAVTSDEDSTDIYAAQDTLKQIQDSVYFAYPDSIAPDSIAPDSISRKIPDPVLSFLDSLDNSKGQVRIIYYGDSQIEGDRITSGLRTILREGRGGTGPGLLLPVMPVMYAKTYTLKSSSNWARYNYLSYRNKERLSRDFGPFMVVCRYLQEGEIAEEPVKASVSIKPSTTADSASAVYELLRIFYGNTDDIVEVNIKAGGELKLRENLKTGTGIKEISCSLGNSRDVQIEFSGKVSPDIYGISIESRTGIIVDNIPQRGSAGLEFTMVGKKNLEESFRKLEPDLFILHYGLNVVRNISDDYSYYEKGFTRQLNLLKEIAPSTPVIVLGVTDMARKVGDSIKSFPNIPYIIKAQENAALNAGVSFWDTYVAMGGDLSIKRWAERTPPLAQRDYVHLTNNGADTLSSMLTDHLFSKADTLMQAQNQIKIDTIISAQIPEEPVLEIHKKKKPLVLFTESLFSYKPSQPLTFTVPAFWLFFLFVLAGYSLVYRKFVLRNGYLFLLSLFFYYKSGGLFLFLLILVILVDFTCGIMIYRSEKKIVRRLFVLFSIISNLGILAYFKYTGFIVETLNDLFGTDVKGYDYLASFSNSYLGSSFSIGNIILPVGISFFTFQSLSYIFDVYRRNIKAVTNPIDFGFYVSFFPQLVAGPIVRASEFIPQLYSEYHLAKREFSHALYLISKGLIKKIIIADFIAVNFVDRIFDAPSVYSGFENLMAVYGYGLQIYCDFSGYTDIAIGLALILGFRLPINFNSPYKAAGLSDFWRRWHISLSRWLKDYLYIPLGGNRKGKFRSAINLMITMLLGGLWHGASMLFVIWGFLHGIGLVFTRIWLSVFKKRHSSRLLKAFAVFITFHFVSFCWIFFRSSGLDRVSEMLSQIIENFNPGSYPAILLAYSNVFILIAIAYLIHFLPERIKESYRGLFIRIPLAVQLGIVMLIAIMLYHMRSTDVMPFIYFRF